MESTYLRKEAPFANSSKTLELGRFEKNILYIVSYLCFYLTVINIIGSVYAQLSTSIFVYDRIDFGLNVVPYDPDK